MQNINFKRSAPKSEISAGISSRFGKLIAAITQLLGRLSAVSFCCGVSVLVGPAIADADDLCLEARTYLQLVSRIRGLDAVKSFACRTENRYQVEAFITESARERLPKDRLQNEEDLFLLLGVIPPGYNYFDGMVTLYTSQLGGYYDPKTKTVVMADWMPPALQRIIALHELTHLLQDQRYNLDSLVGVSVTESDRALAHAALVEGDASVVTLDIEQEERGLPPLAKLKSLKEVSSKSLSASVVENRTIEYVPETLSLLVHFPYVEGAAFAHTLLASGGYGSIDAALKDPPTSTSEILHPERYLRRIKGESAIKAALPPVPSEVVYSDVYGEFFIQALLAPTIKSVRTRAELATNWVADKVYLLQQKEGKRRAQWHTVWINKEAAELFANFLRMHIQGVRGVRFSNQGNKVTVNESIVIAELEG